VKLGDSIARRRPGKPKKRSGGKKKPSAQMPKAAASKPKSRARTASGRRSRPSTRSGSSPSLFGYLGKLALGAIASLAVGYLVATRLIYPAAPPPTGFFAVPSLAGMDLTAATSMLSGVGLILREVDSLNHPKIPDEVVFGQSPLPGQVASVGDSVSLTVSRGPLTRFVPDVTGLSGRMAEVLVTGTGFGLVFDTVASDLPRGQVVETVPEVGTELSLPDTVVMVVSSGPLPFPMPEIVGLNLEEAEELLDSLNLVLGEVREVFRFGFQSGLVIEQTPEEGVPVAKGDEVRLAVGWSRREGVPTRTTERTP